MIKSQSGSILYQALVFSGIAAATTTVIYTQTVKTNELSQLPRARATISQIEAKLRALALSPASYSGCDALVAGSCQFRGDVPEKSEQSSSIIDSLEVHEGGKPIFEITPAPGQSQYFNSSQLKFRAQILYHGSAGNLKPTLVELDVPAEILEDRSGFECPDSSPLFMGFRQGGSADCRSLPSMVCPQGQFVSQIHPGTLAVSCSPLPSLRFAGSTSCLNLRSSPFGTAQPSHFLSQVSWVSSNSIEASCSPRLDPFVGSGFTPDLDFAIVDFNTTEPGPTAVSQPISSPQCVPASTNQNCAFTWSECSGTCGGGAGVQTLIVSVPQSGTGSPCPSPASQSCVNTNPCDVDCLGEWSLPLAHCGSENLTYKVTRQKVGAGAACPFVDGETKQHTHTLACAPTPTPTPTPPVVTCEWVEEVSNAPTCTGAPGCYEAPKITSTSVRGDPNSCDNKSPPDCSISNAGEQFSCSISDYDCGAGPWCGSLTTEAKRQCVCK